MKGRGATKRHLAAAGILLAAGAFGPAVRAQTADADIVPQIPSAETVDVVGAVAGARISLSNDSGATVGALYGASPGNDLTGAFAIGDHALDRHWRIIGG